MASDYEKAHAKYRELATKAMQGDAQAHKDKAAAMQEVRNIERQSARSGVVLSLVRTGAGFQEQRKEVDTKRELQEQYVRKFDDKNVVKIDGKETTLRAWNSKRVLGK
jgi:hypothetical protein